MRLQGDAAGQKHAAPNGAAGQITAIRGHVKGGSTGRVSDCDLHTSHIRGHSLTFKRKKNPPTDNLERDENVQK